MKKLKYISLLLLAIALLTACGGSKKAEQSANVPTEVALAGPEFNADSAYAYCAAQCAFGPRTMNSSAHDDCEKWIIQQFEQYGCQVITQKTDIPAWDGKVLHSTNIIARTNPEAAERIIICAHWDSRPWADNDPNPENHHTPVIAANDGASGVAVMIELARTLYAAATDSAKALKMGIDFVCFDAEDYGAPDWADATSSENTWALGSAYFAQNLPSSPKQGDNGATTYAYGILLDMVGGQGARFCHEGLSKHYAGNILADVWQCAADAGYSSYFINQDGGMVTDDHKPLNEAGIPTIDIIPFHPDCEQSSFGPTWHTLDDDMQHIDPATLKAVGQTLVQFLYTRP